MITLAAVLAAALALVLYQLAASRTRERGLQKSLEARDASALSDRRRVDGGVLEDEVAPVLHQRHRDEVHHDGVDHLMRTEPRNRPDRSEWFIRFDLGRDLGGGFC